MKSIDMISGQENQGTLVKKHAHVASTGGGHMWLGEGAELFLGGNGSQALPGPIHAHELGMRILV